MNEIHRITTPTILVIFGATGHLTKTKLVPALFHLHQKKLLPQFFQVVGFSRQDLSEAAFQSYVHDIVRGFPGRGLPGQGDTESFTKLFAYAKGFFDKQEGYDKLAERLGFQDKAWRTCANKLFYLAVPPEYYKTVFVQLAASGLTIPCGGEEGWTRIVVEKPFGKNAKTAEDLDALLGKLFKEEQIYRIDHYLGKETVQNILAFRFSNAFLEPAFNKEHVERITVRLLESAGVGERCEFYEDVGALRDVGQSHLLQLLALFTMENPDAFEAAPIREARAAVLKSLRALKPREIDRFAVRGQYTGYCEVPGAERASKTETYFCVKAFLNNPRWRGVPIYLESGKGLPESRAEVTVTFKHTTPCLCPAEAGKHYKNVLHYHIQPDERIALSFWVKRPGSSMVLEEREFNFDYQQAYSKKLFVDPYEKLFLDVVEGNQTLFVSTKEIMASWKFIDPIIEEWAKGKPPLVKYRLGSKPKCHDIIDES